MMRMINPRRKKKGVKNHYMEDDEPKKERNNHEYLRVSNMVLNQVVIRLIVTLLLV